MFDNTEIAIDDLPRADDVSWRAMDERFLRRQLTQSAIAAIAVSVGILVLTLVLDRALGLPGIAWALLLIPLIVVPLFAWPVVSVPRRAYAIRERDILYKSGVAWQTVTVVPFNRIQHVETSNTPLDRRFGLSSLKLFTAGGTGGDLGIHGLSATTAEDLRVFVVGKIGSSVERR